MPRTETPSGTVGKASGFQLPAVISGRLARQSESFVSSSPDLSRDLFSPTGARSPRVGRRDLDEILERAARRRSRQAAGGTPLLTARSLFAAEPRAGRSGRAESEDRWERGSEDRPEVPDSPGGRPWRRVRQDSDTSDASSAAGRSSSSGVADGEQRAERPPASPLVAGSVPTPRRSGFRGRAGSEGGILDAPDEYSTAGGGWRGTSRSWLTLGSRSAEAAADDAAETSSVSSSSTDRKSSTRHWLAQGRLDADDASETASIGSGGGGDRRRGPSRGSGWTEPAEEATSATGPPPATPPPKQRHDSPAHSLTIVNVQKASTPTTVPLVNGFSVSDYKAESKADDGDVFSSGDRSTLLRKKLAALRTGAQSERELEKSGDEMDNENRASQLRQKVAALTPEVETQPRDTDVPNEDSGENRAMLLRKKIAAMKKPKPEVEPESTILDDTAEENRATALRQKLAGLRPGSLALPVAADADSRGAEVGPLRSPITPRSPRPDRPSELEPGAEEASRSRPTGRSKLAVLTKPTTPADGSGRPPTDRSPATPRGPRPRSAVRRTSSLSGRDSSVGRSRSRSPVKGRIATLRLKPRRVSQSPDPMARWRSVDDALGSPAGPVHPGGDDRSWEPQTAAVEPPPPPSQDEPQESGQPPADGSPQLPPARPPRRRKSRPGEPGSPVKERVDENRNQICATESSESREDESSSSPPSSPSPGRPSTETEAVSAGEAWLASLTPAGRGRSWSASSCGSLGSFDLERELLSAEESASGVPRQLTSVKSDLIAFSPKKEDEQVPTPPPVAAPAAPAPAPAAASAVPADLSASQPPTPTDGSVAELLKKQELYFQDQLLKRDREMTAMKNANAKLIQQASSNKTEKVLERVAHLVASLTNENGRLRHELNTDRARLVAERDEARQEVANAEAMFADLHRKYEKSKAVLQEHRRCADQNQAAFRDAKERAEREKQRFDMLRQHSEDAHARLEADYEAAEKAHQTELLTLKAKLQLAENREAKLERENREITAICDELIQKMGAGAAR
ncbi:Transforming acidic coiled-coil-containing protein 2 [Amphibalanus amphitrite]|uniref:Transforming acidic coiled-coil-containing protein 2 n=1 Tax=Amphibalanus amphitrite TaxID=1232801 RepID=A0A6A4VBB5_AMPAM|nr:Transforming acidic coiled-coil-containing protein 2 [Amphibalanus amphitrite]